MFRLLTLRLDSVSPYQSWLAAESDVVVQIDELEPGLNIFAVLREVADVLGEGLKRLDITARSAACHIRAPGVDLPGGAFMFSVCVHPFKDFAVAFAGGQLLLQGDEIEAEKILDVLVDRRVVGELAVRAGNGG